MEYETLLKEHNVIHTNRLILRPFREDDSKDVYEFAQLEETVRYLSWQVHKGEDVSRDSIVNFFMVPSTYAIELKGEGKCIGCVSIHLHELHEKGTLSYIVSPYYKNKGYATEAVKAVITLGFDVLHLHRIEAMHYGGNVASKKVMLHCGLTYEGCIRQSVKVKNVFQDVYYYSIINGLGEYV